MASPFSSKSLPFPRPPNNLQATQLPYEPYDDLYEGYNDYDQQLHGYGASSGQKLLKLSKQKWEHQILLSLVESGESLRSKTDVFGGYDNVAGYSPSSSTSSVQVGHELMTSDAVSPSNPFFRLLSATSVSMID